MTFYGSSALPNGTKRTNADDFLYANGTDSIAASTAELSKDEMFVEDLLHAHEAKFCTYQPVNIFVTTFNVNGRSPPANLKDWLGAIDAREPPDLVVIGLQEMDLALGSYVVDNALKENEWLVALKLNIPQKVFRLVKSARLIGIFLVVFCRSGVTFGLSDVCLGSIPTGFLNFGNKGGVGMSFRLNDTHICLVNSHLAAGGNELYRRNQDFRLISQMRFRKGHGMFEHDVVIWLGDLNYRLDIPLTYDEVVQQIKEKRFAQLFYFDQLKEQQRLRVAFNGFMEQQPSFVPTYKFDPGTHNWDTSEKKRVPAWCDRILYWVKDKNVGIEQVTYESAHQVVLSDHKPVLSTFRVQVKKVDRPRRSAIYEQLLREVDKRQNELLPQITLSNTEFHFGTVLFDQPSLAVLTITNTGQTPTHFSFKPARPEADRLEEWLTITPLSSFIDVGGAVEVTLQILVFDESSCKVPKDGAELSSIIIVHLTGGRDYFIVVDAKYQREVKDLISFD
ncbi:hypothetical protein niasHT_010296 [Heterodera trifolii]|uniref:Inositol polyphosphate-related phosphatase domain-containing protein n=1 Tax=Heterodera trifolii TaxID=157864 RepID=A0ABD2M5U4_9BILA